MQQVAASRKDIASVGILNAEQSTDDLTGSGNEFAKVMETNNAERRQPRNQEAPARRDDKNANDKPAVAERPANEGVQRDENLKNQKTEATKTDADSHKTGPAETEKSAESTVKQGANKDAHNAEYNEDMHEEWVAILQKLNGNARQPEEQGTMISIYDKETPEGIELPPIVASEDTGEDATDVVDWKEALKDKLLNSGETFTILQRKAMDKEVNSLSDEEIQAVLDSDKALKDLLSDILNDPMPSPQDTSLLLALSQNGNAAEGLEGDSATLSSKNGVALNSLGSETGVAESQQATDKPMSAGSEEVKAPKETNELAALLSSLDDALQSDKQKLAAVDNLTRRVETSELGQTPAGKSFVDSLKALSAELKNQQNIGETPPINLNQLVTEALNQQSSTEHAAALEAHVSGSLQQISSIANSGLSLEPATRDNLVNQFQNALANRESATSQLEAAKAQNQQQNQILDKAINMQKPEAAQDLANKVQVMLNQKNMVADIRLDPPDLGQMQIKISMQGDTASVSMVVQSQAAREALEHNQPRLKELLDQQGIELGQSSVEQQEQQSRGDGDGGQFAGGENSEDGEEIGPEQTADRQVTLDEPDGIDYFA